MFIYRSRFLTRGEVWFDDEPDDTPVDWIYYRHRSRPPARARWKFFYTVLIDLAKSPAQLLARLDPKTARKIEEAETKDHTRWQHCEANDPKIMDAVEQLWNATATTRNAAPLDRPWLDKIIETGALELTATQDPTGKVLTYHLSYVGKKRAQDLIVVSPTSPVPNMALRNRIHRANCLGHWKTMLALKERGICLYDFGGWYPGTTNIRFLGMNAFKESFGGEVVREFGGEEIRTARGWFVLMGARILKRAGLLKPTGGAPDNPSPNSKNDAPVTAKNCEVSPAV
jgi:hypothetical protein